VFLKKRAITQFNKLKELNNVEQAQHSNFHWSVQEIKNHINLIHIRSKKRDTS